MGAVSPSDLEGCAIETPRHGAAGPRRLVEEPPRGELLALAWVERLAVVPAAGKAAGVELAGAATAGTTDVLAGCGAAGLVAVEAAGLAGMAPEPAPAVELAAALLLSAPAGTAGDAAAPAAGLALLRVREVRLAIAQRKKMGLK